jgi:hypothetical protein
MSDSAPPAPSHGKNMVRNIITGVITTVAGACAVYFLGFRNTGGSSSSGNYLEVKEATTKAWKDYVSFENLESKSTTMLANHLKDIDGLDEFKQELTKESDKFNIDVERLAKTDNIDGAFVSLLKRRLDAEKEAMEKWDAFFASCKNILNTTVAGQERSEKITAAYTKMQTAGSLILERTKTEITDLAKSLSDKYGQSFAVTDLILFKENNNTANNNNNTTNNPNNNNGTNTNNNNNTLDTNTNNGYVAGGNSGNNNNSGYSNANRNVVDGRNFAGEWNTAGAVITLSADGRMSWEMSTGQNTSGTWRFYNNQIYMTYPDQYGNSNTYLFNLYYVKANSFTMQLASYPNYVYQLVRNNENY